MDRSKFEAMIAQMDQVPAEPQIQQPSVEDSSEKEILEDRLQVGFDVVEVQRVGLQPGDVLMVTVKNDDLSQNSVDALRMQLATVFPDNKVFVFAMGTSDDVKISVVSDHPVSYCSNCNCGKKEASNASEST